MNIINGHVYVRNISMGYSTAYLCSVFKTTIYKTYYFFGVKVRTQKNTVVNLPASTCFDIINRNLSFSGKPMFLDKADRFVQHDVESSEYSWPRTISEVLYTTVVHKGTVRRDLRYNTFSSDLGTILSCETHIRYCNVDNGVIVWFKTPNSINPWYHVDNTTCYKFTNHLYCKNDFDIPLVKYVDSYIRGYGIDTIVFVPKTKLNLTKPLKFSKRILNSKYFQILNTIIPSIDNNFASIDKVFSKLSKFACSQYILLNRLLEILSLSNSRIFSSFSQTQGFISMNNGDLLSLSSCQPVPYEIVCDKKLLVRNGLCPANLMINVNNTLYGVEPITHILQQLSFIECTKVRPYFSLETKDKFLFQDETGCNVKYFRTNSIYAHLSTNISLPTLVLNSPIDFNFHSSNNFDILRDTVDFLLQNQNTYFAARGVGTTRPESVPQMLNGFFVTKFFQSPILTLLDSLLNFVSMSGISYFLFRVFRIIFLNAGYFRHLLFKLCSRSATLAPDAVELRDLTETPRDMNEPATELETDSHLPDSEYATVTSHPTFIN